MYSLTRPEDFFDLFPSVNTGTLSKKVQSQFDNGMKMDIHETEKGYEAVFDVPGAAKDHVKISHEGQVLTVIVDHKEEKEKTEKDKKGYKVHWRERSSGFMKRSVQMPDNCDFDKATAKQDNGVLTITFPKTEEGEKKKYISIN